MIVTKPEVEPNGLYGVSQAARALQVNRHTILRYAEAGLITLHTRKANGRRVVSGKDIIKCWRDVYL